MSSTEQNLNPIVSSAEQDLNPAVSSIEHGLNLAVSSIEHGMNLAVSSIEHGLNLAVSSIEHGMNPAVSSIEQDMNPAVSSIEQDMNPEVSSPVHDLGPTMTDPEHDLNPTLSSSKHDLNPSMNNIQHELNLTVSFPEQNLNLTVSRPEQDLNPTVSSPENYLNPTVSSPENYLNPTVSSPELDLNLTASRCGHDPTLTVPQIEDQAPPTYDQAMEEAAQQYTPITLPHSTGPANVGAPGGPLVSGPYGVDGPLNFVNFTEGTFSSLMQHANAWLREHTGYRALSCETLELPRDNDGISFGSSTTITDRASFNIRVASNVQFIRILRLWVLPRGPGDVEKPQQFSYVDILPRKRTQRVSLFSREKFEFESTQDAVLRFNDRLREEPLPGKILNIQTCELRFRDRIMPGFEKFDENYFTWVREKSDSPEYFYLTFLRVFHETLPSGPSSRAIPQIGYLDFVPKQSEESSKDFEKLLQPACRIQNWINENQDKNVINVQTLELRLNKDPGYKFKADTHRSLFKDKDTGDIRYLKHLRVYFQHFLHMDASFLVPSTRLTLTYKTFCPEKISRPTKTELPLFETVIETWQRSSAWLRLTGVKIFCAETVPLRHFPSKCVYNSPESTYLDNRGSSDWHELWLLTHRVYIDGHYIEPPSSLLPPLPRLPPEESSSCVIL